MSLEGGLKRTGSKERRDEVDVIPGAVARWEVYAVELENIWVIKGEKKADFTENLASRDR